MIKVMKKLREDYVRNVEMAREIFPGSMVMDVTIDGGMKKLDTDSLKSIIRERLTKSINNYN